MTPLVCTLFTVGIASEFLKAKSGNLGLLQPDFLVSFTGIPFRADNGSQSRQAASCQETMNKEQIPESPGRVSENSRSSVAVSGVP